MPKSRNLWTRIKRWFRERRFKAVFGGGIGLLRSDLTQLVWEGQRG
jgi:hypothetical protein